MEIMDFVSFRDKVEARFNEMCETGNLFTTDVDKDAMWDLYLNSFPAGTNEIYRKRREYDCSCCRHAIKSFGNVVAVNPCGEVMTIWDVDVNGSQFEPVAAALAQYVRSRPIGNAFVVKEKQLGTESCMAEIDPGSYVTFSHFHVTVPSRYVEKHRSIGDVQGERRTSKETFKRAMEEISLDAVNTVLELIQQNSLYRGEEWKQILESFRDFKKEYMGMMNEAAKDRYAWVASSAAGTAISHIRNHSFGTLLVNISEGMDLDSAVRAYESIVAPSNYKRPKAIFTKRMLEEAQKTVEELGLMDSLPRRFATLDDITANNILFCNRDSAKQISGSVFDRMADSVAVKPKSFSRVEEISAKDFVEKVLPTAKEVELLLENRHAENMVSLIAPVNEGSKSMFKWDNSFGWAYAGNLADSDIKKNVKNAGGKVDGDLRFSIQWNETGDDSCDLDAHCKENPGDHIYFNSCARKPGFSQNGGQLDVDVINPGGEVAVENITYASRNSMHKGRYDFYVHQYSGSAHYGFRAEIEFDGQIHKFDYDKPMRSGQIVRIAAVDYDGENFSLHHIYPDVADCAETCCKDVWGVKTNQFVPVSMICYSPNYWNEQDGIGNRHYFFMLKGCTNPERPNGMYNEYLRNDLMKHKRVFEALGAQMRVEKSDNQLSGVGFCSTRRADVVVRVTGATKRVMKIKF